MGFWAVGSVKFCISLLLNFISLGGLLHKNANKLTNHNDPIPIPNLYLLCLLQRKHGWADKEVGGAELALVDVDDSGTEGIGTVAATGGNLPLAVMESLFSLKLADLEIEVLLGGGGGVGLAVGNTAMFS